MAVDVGQAPLEAVVVVAEALVVEADQVEDGGVEVVDFRRVLLRLETELVAGAVAETLFTPAFTR